MPHVILSRRELLALRSFSGRLWLDQLLLFALIRDELPLAHMGIFTRLSRPHLVRKRSPLTLHVLVRAVGLETWAEFAWDLEVRELAAFHGAIRAIATKWHGGMFERAIGVCAIREELADLFCLVSCLDSR